jgi:hypothetical protein
MQDRQPRFARGIEASRRNALECSACALLSIFAVDVKEFRDTRGLARHGRHPYTSQAMSQGISDSGEALGAETRHGRQSAIVRRSFKVGESLEAQFFVKPVRQYPADSWSRREKSYGIGLATEPVQHRQLPMRDQLANRSGDALADGRQLLQTLKPVIAKHFVHRRLHRSDTRRRTQVRSDPIPIRPLVAQ